MNHLLRKRIQRPFLTTHRCDRNWGQLVPSCSHITDGINPGLRRHFKFVDLDVALAVDFYACVLQCKQVRCWCAPGPICHRKRFDEFRLVSGLHSANQESKLNQRCWLGEVREKNAVDASNARTIYEANGSQPCSRVERDRCRGRSRV